MATPTISPNRIAQLADCASLARSLAAEFCWRDPQSGESCAWYHGFWPYLRLLDYGSSPALHEAFYIDGLSALEIERKPARVLISGAADFAMLEVVLKAFGTGGGIPHISVVDRCDTPLALCRWFAERTGQRIETLATDILDYKDAIGFDVIVTHSFLGSFTPKDRARLARRWFELLRPGGKLLTINRLRKQNAAATISFSTDQSTAFVARLSDDLQKHQNHLDCEPDEIVAMGANYLKRKRSFPVSSREELQALFLDAGFVLDCCSELEAADPGASRPEGPTMPGGATYMKIIARRDDQGT